MQYIPDNTERFPDRPREEDDAKEHRANAWIKVMVELDVYGYDEEDIKKEVAKKLKETVDLNIVDRDVTEMEVVNIEEI